MASRGLRLKESRVQPSNDHHGHRSGCQTQTVSGNLSQGFRQDRNRLLRILGRPSAFPPSSCPPSLQLAYLPLSLSRSDRTTSSTSVGSTRQMTSRWSRSESALTLATPPALEPERAHGLDRQVRPAHARHHRRQPQGVPRRHQRTGRRSVDRPSAARPSRKARALARRSPAAGFLVAPPAWLMTGSISRLVLAIMSKDTRETLERWQFDVKTEEPVAIECVAPSLSPRSRVKQL